jgi:transketolase
LVILRKFTRCGSFFCDLTRSKLKFANVQSSLYFEPLGEEEIRLTKRNYSWPEDAKFLVPEGVQAHFQQHLGQRGHRLRQEWMQTFDEYSAKYPDLADQLYKMQHRQLPDDWETALPTFPPDVKGLGGRDASASVLNAIAQQTIHS